MRRFMLVAMVLSTALMAAPASATPPVHERFEVSGTWDPGPFDPISNPDGYPEMCSFDYVQSWHGIANVTTWGGDPELGTFDRQIWTGPIVVTHTNRDPEPDTVLVETASYTVILEDGGASDTESGVFWHLRDAATGRMVLVMAGRMVFDNVAGTVTFTPNVAPEFWGVICPALGGEAL